MITWNFFRRLYLNIKYTRMLKKIYKKENLITNLSQLFNIEFRVDWVGRIYAVLNPTLLNKELDVNSQIYEYDENGLNNNAYLEQWIMQRMLIVQKFISANNLFDLLTYKIEKLDDYNNYLLVLQPITYKMFIDSAKSFIKLWAFLGIIIIVAWILLTILL